MILCSRCNQSFPKAFFIKDNKVLKTCQHCRAYYITNLIKIKQYRIDNKENTKKYQHLYRENNQELKDKKKEYYNNNLPQQLLSFARRRSLKNNIEFSITKQDIINIFPKNNCCPIFKTKFTVGNKIHCPKSATLDKIDNSKGYTPNNIHIISYKANQIKNNATLNEIITIKNSLMCPIKNYKVNIKNKSYLWYGAKQRATKNNIKFNLGQYR